MTEKTSGHSRSGGKAPSLLYAVKQVELAVRSHLDGLVRPYGLTTIQYTALTVLERRDEMTAAQLARNSFVRAQSMQDVVTALLSQGLISRYADPTNQRRLLIKLTDEGRRVLDKLAPHVASLETQMTQGLDAAQREALRTALNSCRAALTTHDD